MVFIEFYMGVWVLYVWAIAHAGMPNGSVSNGEVCILSSEILSWNLFSALKIGIYICIAGLHELSYPALQCFLVGTIMFNVSKPYNVERKLGSMIFDFK